MSFSYAQPTTALLLSLSGFIILLNLVGFILDRLLYCGLIGQVLLGLAWGNAGLSLIPLDLEVSITNLGYIGLLLLVFEGMFLYDPICNQ
jgi:Kef-type K+ transport system membrane component KefB